MSQLPSIFFIRISTFTDVDKVRLKIEKVLEPTRKDILDYVSLRLLNEIKDVSAFLTQQTKISFRPADDYVSFPMNDQKYWEMKSSGSTYRLLVLHGCMQQT